MKGCFMRSHSKDQKAELDNQPAMLAGRSATPERHLECAVTRCSVQRHRSIRSYSCPVNGSAALILMFSATAMSFPGFLSLFSVFSHSFRGVPHDLRGDVHGSSR